MRLAESDHAQVTAAVTAAEAQTDGEIVTVVAARSDSYHDVGLHYAVLAMLLVPALFAAQAGLLSDRIAGGWDAAPPPARIALMVSWTTLLVQAVVFLIVRYGLAYMPLRMALTPGSTKTRRVRRRAMTLFRTAAEKRTKAATGVLLYLSLAEHRAELIADESIHSKVAPELWGDAMADLIEEVKAGRPGAGMAKAVERIGAVLAEHFPRSAADQNELPDRLIEL